ncbi:hypothetical protein PE36_03381 [Moritella sp. PE36]|nr:hypothetical protein PE36_03381 [Moritella sp. PE36]
MTTELPDDIEKLKQILESCSVKSGA